MKQFEAPAQSLGGFDAEAAASLIAAAADVALVVDGDGVICDVSIGSDDLGFEGYSQWIGRRWTDTVTPESRPKVASLLHDAGGKPAAVGATSTTPPPRGPTFP